MSKKILLAAVAFFLSLGMLFAQAPEKFNYQGVARNTAGQPLANQNIGLRISIRTGTSTGTIQYRETHNVTTNAYGLYNVAVGGGTAVTGTMNAVTWSAGSKFMQVQIDPAGGTSYTNLGNTELLSVPYALYAANGNQGPAGTNGTNGLDGKTVLSGNGAPANSLGSNGDFYIRTSNNRIYGPKTGGVWGSSTSLIGPAGTNGQTVLNGNSAPINSLGNNGDFYIRTSNNRLYGPKTSGTWGSSTSLIGPAGTNGTNGMQGIQGIPGPQGNPGVAGPAGSANIIGTTNKLIKFTGATTGGNSQITDNGTRVSIGAVFPSSTTGNPKLSIQSSGSGPALEIDALAGNNGIYVKNNDALEATIYSRNDGYQTSIWGAKGNVAGNTARFTSEYNSGTIGSGIVKVEYTGTVSNRDHVGIYSKITPNTSNNYGIGVYGYGGYKGIDGISINNGFGFNYGVKGYVSNAGSNSYALHGTAKNNTGSTGGSKYGLYATASGGANNVAGYFADGNVQIINMLSKGGGTFKIDHPNDPENKYLYHSFVESPDMMNIYNGNITTDAQGFATVIMPDYFKSLNTDFRYQLTVMGTFAQAIIKEKISNNSFVIQTNQPNVEVSWQVTGVRNDKFAQVNRVQVEVEKPAAEKGLYLHSEAWGQSKDKDLNYIIHEKPIEDKKAKGGE